MIAGFEWIAVAASQSEASLLKVASIYSVFVVIGCSF